MNCCIKMDSLAYYNCNQVDIRVIHVWYNLTIWYITHKRQNLTQGHFIYWILWAFLLNLVLFPTLHHYFTPTQARLLVVKLDGGLCWLFVIILIVVNLTAVTNHVKYFRYLAVTSGCSSARFPWWLWWGIGEE